MPQAHGAPTVADTVERQLAFERTLVDISARFAAVSPGDVEEEIRRGLRALLGFLDVDRSTFFEVSEDGTLMTLCSVAVDGVEPLPSGPFSLALPWYIERLLAGDIIAMPRLPEGLPSEAGAEAAYARRIGMRANLTIPLRIGDRVRFGIAAGAFRESRGWSPEVLAA